MGNKPQTYADIERVICGECILPDCIRTGFPTPEEQWRKRGCILAIVLIESLPLDQALDCIRVTARGIEYNVQTPQSSAA